MNIKPIEVFWMAVVVIVICCVVLVFTNWLFPPKSDVVVQLAANSPITVQVPAEDEQWESGIYIDNDECFIRIQSGDTVPLYNYFDNSYRLRIIIDGEVYWIRLEADHPMPNLSPTDWRTAP